MPRSTYGRAAPLLACVGFFLVGCTDTQTTSTAPEGAGPAALAEGRGVPSIEGTWNWSEEVKFVFHSDIALAVGITPEGGATHATCFNSGTITFDQSGSTFDGTMTQPIGTCRTRGGQEFSNVFDEPFPIVDGSITGSSIHFGFSSPDCPYNAVLTLQGDQAVSASGQGNCNAPQLVFHSQWEASR